MQYRLYTLRQYVGVSRNTGNQCPVPPRVPLPHLLAGTKRLPCSSWPGFTHPRNDFNMACVSWPFLAACVLAQVPPAAQFQPRQPRPVVFPPGLGNDAALALDPGRDTWGFGTCGTLSALCAIFTFRALDSHRGGGGGLTWTHHLLPRYSPPSAGGPEEPRAASGVLPMFRSVELLTRSTGLRAAEATRAEEASRLSCPRHGKCRDVDSVMGRGLEIAMTQSRCGLPFGLFCPGLELVILPAIWGQAGPTPCAPFGLLPCVSGTGGYTLTHAPSRTPKFIPRSVLSKTNNPN